MFNHYPQNGQALLAYLRASSVYPEFIALLNLKKSKKSISYFVIIRLYSYFCNVKDVFTRFNAH